MRASAHSTIASPFARAAARHVAGVLVAAAMAWLALSAIARLADEISLAKHRCEIRGLRGNCPAQPAFRIARRDGVHLEIAGTALQSPAGCFQRVREFGGWCRTERPIVARFIRDSILVEGKTFPAHSPTRCEIAGLSGNCPAQSLRIDREDGVVGELSDTALGSSDGCFQRADEYRAWCRTEKPIAARFFRDSRLLEEKSFKAHVPARCEISGLRDNCPAQPTLRLAREDGVLPDTAERALESPNGCFRRAEEFLGWCRTRQPIVARFYRNARLVDERTLSRRDPS